MLLGCHVLVERITAVPGREMEVGTDAGEAGISAVEHVDIACGKAIVTVSTLSQESD